MTLPKDVVQIAEELPCQEPGCVEMGFPCYLPDKHYEPEYYCSGHAFEHGHCRMCGEFWGGIESFEFRQGGYCDNCFEQIDDATGNDDEDEWGSYDERDF